MSYDEIKTKTLSSLERKIARQEAAVKETEQALQLAIEDHWPAAAVGQLRAKLARQTTVLATSNTVRSILQKPQQKKR